MRQLENDAGAVAGARVAAGGAAMGQVYEDFERLFDHVVRGGAVERGDESEPAGIMLETWIVKPLSRRKPHDVSLLRVTRRAIRKLERKGILRV